MTDTGDNPLLEDQQVVTTLPQYLIEFVNTVAVLADLDEFDSALKLILDTTLDDNAAALSDLQAAKNEVKH